MQVAIMNKKEKEELVVKLHQENKTIRQIAEIVHISFKDIGTIIRRIDGDDDDRYIDTKLSNKTKATQALYLFEHGKKPIDAAIELDLPASEIEEILQEYWVLNQLEDLALIYYEIRNHLTLFLKLFHTLKKNKSINQKNIGRMLRYAVYDLPSLENKIQRLTSDVIDLEWNKKQSRDEVAILNSSIVQLKKLLNWYKMEIEQKKEIILNLNRQLNQKIYTLEERQIGNA
jgi:hypothetical protein